MSGFTIYTKQQTEAVLFGKVTRFLFRFLTLDNLHQFDQNVSDTSSIDHLVMREFVCGPPRYHLAIKGLRKKFVVLLQSSGLFYDRGFRTFHRTREMPFLKIVFPRTKESTSQEEAPRK